MIDACAKLQRDGEKSQADVSAAKKKMAAKELKECEAAVAAFTAFVANCTAAGMEQDGVTWKKPHFKTDRLDTKVGSGNLHSDADLKAILRLTFVPNVWKTQQAEAGRDCAHSRSRKFR